MDGFNALDLDNNGIADDQVNTITEINPLSFVDHGQSKLAGHREPLSSQLMPQAGMIGAFQQSRPKRGVNFHRGGDDLMCDVVYSGTNLLRCGGHATGITSRVVFSL